MAKKLPVIIDIRSGNAVLQAFQKLLPNLQKMDNQKQRWKPDILPGKYRLSVFTKAFKFAS